MTTPRPPVEGREFFTLADAPLIAGVSEDVLKKAIKEGLLRTKRVSKGPRGMHVFGRKQLADWYERLEDA